MAADVLRILLLVTIISMDILAVMYLVQRRMTTMEYLLWGLAALLLPLLGPYLVIATRAGESRRRPRPL